MSSHTEIPLVGSQSEQANDPGHFDTIALVIRFILPRRSSERNQNFLDLHSPPRSQLPDSLVLSHITRYGLQQLQIEHESSFVHGYRLCDKGHRYDTSAPVKL
jgi:hypothetical protein